MSRMDFWPVTGSLSQMTRRKVTLSGTENVMPRSRHSLTVYLCFKETGSPHSSHESLMRVPTPHTWHVIIRVRLPSWRSGALHLPQCDGRWWLPWRAPHLHSQFPIE